MPSYDASFDPPAPVADVTVTHPVTATRRVALRGKLDSGADLTVIPARLVLQLQLSPKGGVWTRGYDGSYTQRLVYYVRLSVEGFELPAVRCVATDRANVLLGRNVLNRFLITLDGRNLSFEIRVA